MDVRSERSNQRAIRFAHHLGGFMGKSGTFAFAVVVAGLLAAVGGAMLFNNYACSGTYHSEPNAQTRHLVKLLNEDPRWERGPNPNAIGIYDQLDRDWRILIEFDGERCVRIEQAREDIRRDFAGFELEMVRKAFEERRKAVYGGKS